MTTDILANIVGSRFAKSKSPLAKTALILATSAVFLILACSPESPTRSQAPPTPTPIPLQAALQTIPTPFATEASVQRSPTANTETVIAPTATPTENPPTRILPPTPTPETDAPTVLLIAVAEPEDNMTPYDREDWRHWVDEDGDCQDARNEALIAESLSPVTFRSDRECRVVAGQWLAPYTGATILDPGNLDIDHMVPLANAHRSGAWQWSVERKRRYANYLDEAQHLIAVTAGANRSKGAKGPEDWKPPDRSYWCKYAIDWTNIKMEWKLTVSQAEFTALDEMLATCDSHYQLAQVVTMERPGLSSPKERPTATPTSDALGGVYESCDAAQAAGESRVQGSRGSGHGFPKAMVPSARDGDGDGVVCER